MKDISETESMNEQELNALKYDEAIIYDKRTYYQYYLSLMKRKNIIIFTFFQNDDYNVL